MLKDAYEKEVTEIKEKRNNVWCHMSLNLDALTLMLMRHDCVEDDGIGDGAKAWKLLQERFQSVETPTVVTLMAQLARQQFEDAEDLDSFFIREQESQGYKKQGKQSQRQSSTPWSSMVFQLGMKVSLYRKQLTRLQTL